MSDPGVDELRARSRALFGQTYRLEVMIAVARSDGLVCLTDLAAAAGIQNVSRIQSAVSDLKDAQLLIETESGDSRRRWLQRANSTVWTWVLELASAFEYDAGRQPGRLTEDQVSGNTSI